MKYSTTLALGEFPPGKSSSLVALILDWGDDSQASITKKSYWHVLAAGAVYNRVILVSRKVPAPDFRLKWWCLDELRWSFGVCNLDSGDMSSNVIAQA